jgi:hypothetical protein
LLSDTAEDNTATPEAGKTMTAQATQFAILPPPLAGTDEDIHVDLAITRLDRQRALELRQEVYQRKGLSRETALKPRVSPQSCVPGSAIFVAKQEAVVMGTISFYMDSVMGLPMDEVYGKEVDTMRERYARIAEVGSLAVLETRRDLGVITMLYQAAFRWAVTTNTQCVVACVRPSTRRVYSKVLLFEVLGESKRLPRFLGTPSIPIALDIANAPALCREVHGAEPDSQSHKIFCDLHLPNSYAGHGAAEYRQWSDEEVSWMVEAGQLVVTEDDRLYIERHYAIHGKPDHVEQARRP